MRQCRVRAATAAAIVNGWVRYPSREEVVLGQPDGVASMEIGFLAHFQHEAVEARRIAGPLRRVA